MRGEYGLHTYLQMEEWELPPRARRIQVPELFPLFQIGTTSACAENTHHGVQPCETAWNYLRVRGEYLSQYTDAMFIRELPPRARRILQAFMAFKDLPGTTSACAENTHQTTFLVAGTRNYLRVRGEYPGPKEYRPHHQELPPRARRILTLSRSSRSFLGTTSACAENTTPLKPLDLE